MKDENDVTVNGLAGCLYCIYFSNWECGDHQWPWKSMLWASVIPSFPEQEHKESATSYTCSHTKYDRKLNVVSLIEHEHPRSCPAWEDITHGNMLMNDSLRFSGRFIYICTYVGICVCIYIYLYMSFYSFRKEAADFYVDHQSKPFYK